MNPSGMQLIANTLNSIEASGHGFEQIELVPCICTDICVRGPHQDAVDPAIALSDIIKVALHGVIPLASVKRGVKEVAIV